MATDNEKMQKIFAQYEQEVSEVSQSYLKLRKDRRSQVNLQDERNPSEAHLITLSEQP